MESLVPGFDFHTVLDNKALIVTSEHRGIRMKSPHEDGTQDRVVVAQLISSRASIWLAVRLNPAEDLVDFY